MSNPTAAELLAVSQGSRVAFKGKMDSMAIEINHLHRDLRKVADWIIDVEGDMETPKKRGQVSESRG
ncbi:hypothetical protein NDU88_003986 [Pleurodeles waltl]|uniref:Uncharacterized protein n=1 Tax=Pleurodeles waltl TaxID=8319 RepID=A0AAV7PB55_PLEWA|nr:hypothetical protein NDU88_003986 [Pleurodeles waltl]